MEGYADNYVTHCHPFFILGASDDLAANLKKTAIRISMRLSSSVEYLLNLPMRQLMEFVEEIIEIDEERKKHNEQKRKR